MSRFSKLPAMKFCISCLAFIVIASTAFATEKPLTLKVQSRSPSGKVVIANQQWKPSRTAIIVCDMWDLHHCKNAVVRETEMAPKMNEVIEKARQDGVLIIHAPSSCMKHYEGTPARERAKSAEAAAWSPDKIAEWCKQIPSEDQAIYPIDQSDGGEDDDPIEHAVWVKELEAKGLDPREPWTKQIELLRIDQDLDAISDSGSEIWNLLESRNIDNVILMGVHVNMCVSGRPFGLRQLAKNGKRVVLMRDMTDAMYNPQRWPFVSHVRGTELYIDYVEKRIAPTITSNQIIGGQPFRFSSATAGSKRLQIILLGDSTTEASVPRKLAPDEPQLEDMLRIKLACEPGIPPTDVYNEGRSGEFIRSLIDSGRYDKSIASKPKADFIFIRYGINDLAKREAFEVNFPKDFHELLERLRRDHPNAVLIPMTVIPYSAETTHADINAIISQIATDEKLTLLDIAPRYLAELRKGPDMLNYRRFPVAKIPESLRPVATPHIQLEPEPKVIVLDNRLDAVFGHLPGWTSDRHPNLAGYNIIADETAKWLAPLIRKQANR